MRRASHLAFALALSSVLFACGGASEPPATGQPAPSSGGREPGGPAGGPATPIPSMTTPPSTPTTYFPPAGNEWETTDAARAGFDPAKLEEVTAFAEASSSTTFLVLHDGRILVERYWDGATSTTLRDIASAQKSIVSLLVGAFVGQGAFGLDDKVTSLLGAGWSNGTAEEEAPITVRQLLTMTSGLDGQLRYDAPAGSKWFYNTDAYHRIELILETKSNKTLQELTRSTLFDAIGVGTSQWAKRAFQKDAKGVPVSALEMNARDMARVGLVVMTDGAWKQQTVIPASYLGVALATSQAFNPSYGFLFWLNGQSSALLPPSQPKPGPMMPSGPADVVAALGANDQKIYVSRSNALVVVRQGPKATTAVGAAALSAWDDELWKRILAAKVP
jgi:CubicO group peptidase (beta-lactamase class C family)